MNLRLENRRALVSGSTAGIGFAIAKALAAEGAHIIINGLSSRKGELRGRLAEAIATAQ